MIKGSYKIHVGNYDWGAAVDQAVITFNDILESFHPEYLKVVERKLAGNENTEEHELYEVIRDRKITKVYFSDDDGNPVEGNSRYLTIDLYVSPEEGSPFACTGKTQIFIWSNPYELHFIYHDPNAENDQNELEIEKAYTKRKTAADSFMKKVSKEYAGVTYDYAEYIPKKETKTLYVWLHGLGEGSYDGSDVYLPILGRKGTTMAGDTFQNMIGGAVVLVPQCPTYWMDGDGKQTNFNSAEIQADGTSYYSESLEAFIEDYAKEMGARKIILAGCSNGGYMSLVLAMRKPDRYDAVIPICEAVPDVSISEEQIARLREVPLYFVYAKNDPIVVPQLHEIPTIRRLQEGKCKDLHVSVTDNVVDTSGLYKDAEGNPYEYLGHLSWIYYDNNETRDDNGLSAWEWISGRIR